MPTVEAPSVPPDQQSVTELSGQGLSYRQVLPTAEDFPAFVQAIGRGFLGREASKERIEAARNDLAHRRMLGVYDPATRAADTPVATMESFVTELTVEQGRTTPMWAISGVTVSPTHRRRGLAKAMLEGELRSAATAGLALAGLTVSEATIYGRWGFSPAVFTTDWTIQTKRARWIGPRPTGRLDFVTREELPELLAELFDRVRLLRAGEVQGWQGLWQNYAGLRPGVDGGDKIRAVQYTDEAGTVRGLLIYTLTEDDNDFTEHTLNISGLFADGTDAHAALWRFALEHDLVGTVTATLCSVDEPLRWMIADQRAAKVTQTDHQWLRVLDVPAALQARSYPMPGTLSFAVTDPLGYAEGTWQLDVNDDGGATVTPHAGEPQVCLTVGALGSILLGGVAAGTLRAAGLVQGDVADIDALEATFSTSRPPLLSLWY